MNKRKAEARVDSDMKLDASDHTPKLPQTILLPLIVVFATTVFAQLVSLAFGRSNAEQSFESIVLPSVLFLSAVTLPLSGLGIVLGRQIGLGTPLLAALL
ncbi:MAG: hypothetical protein ABGZ53_06040 [Fuerstiella sp.]